MRTDADGRIYALGPRNVTCQNLRELPDSPAHRVRGINIVAVGTPTEHRTPTDDGRVMTSATDNETGNRFCKACGTPAEDGRLCERCRAALPLPDGGGLVDDQGAAVRRDFEGRAEQ
ncbi:hypothetical protein [Streptomyces flavofungini]|uniref:hypothetical protein n=1 Tax=Streptomyces flavofungini TaxID=68200 RepID=UPI0034E00092